jgi:hypothetical protein
MAEQNRTGQVLSTDLGTAGPGWPWPNVATGDEHGRSRRSLQPLGAEDRTHMDVDLTQWPRAGIREGMWGLGRHDHDVPRPDAPLLVVGDVRGFPFEHDE